jgi:hypothetical protein
MIGSVDMKKFLLVERQSGGCDYTIGCGIRVTTITAESLEDAIKQCGGNLTEEDLRKDEDEDDEDEDYDDEYSLISDYQAKNEHGINSAFLYEIASSTNLEKPILSSRSVLNKLKKEAKEKEQEKKELEELKRLKKKYNK